VRLGRKAMGLLNERSPGCRINPGEEKKTQAHYLIYALGFFIERRKENRQIKIRELTNEKGKPAVRLGRKAMGLHKRRLPGCH